MSAALTTTKLPEPLARHSFAALTGYAELSLEEILIAMCQLGKPRLSRHADSWYCALDMHVAAAGTEFKIASEFSCPTPIAAARQCAERAVATLKQYAA